ncbi:MAG: PPC domain-containing protein [Spirochaetes bacterium]|nr:PPC domain-containing protein [Spirochaetota bacterium]
MTRPAPRRALPVLGLAAALLLATGFPAENMPHIGYAFPSGAKAGQKVTVLFGGQNLEGITNIFVTGEKVTAQFQAFNRDLDRRALNNLENQKAVIEGKIKNAGEDEKPALEKRLAYVMQQMSYQEPAPSDPEMNKFMMGMKQRKQINVQLTDMVRIEVAVPADALPGRREIRLSTPKGISEPLSFFVSQMEEALEREPNDTAKQATPVETLPAVLNGQILPGDFDRFRIKVKKGQNLVFAVQARDLMPYLADAVPGWFQAVLAVYDASGKEVAYADHWRHLPDPLIQYTPAEDGELTLEIRDSIYRGREDFVYRVTVGVLPFITGIFPLGGPLKGKTSVELMGWNLPTAQTLVETKAVEGGLIHINPVSSASYNPINFLVEDLPEIRAAGDNHGVATAQAVRVPAAINGRIEKPGTMDCYRFSGKAGDRVIAEVWARRLGSPLDSALRVLDSKGKVIQTNDDFTDQLAGLVTHHADSYLHFALPETGEYTLLLRDTQGKGGADYAYRLRLSTPRPDFRLRVTPSCVSVPGGGTAALDVHLQRIDGFDGEVTLSLAKAPSGAFLGGAQLKSLERVIPITLTIPDVELDRITPQIIATAKIGGKTVRHTAIAAEDMMQAFAYRHLVSAQELVLKVTPKPRLSLAIDVADDNQVPLLAGQETLLPIKLLGTARGARAPDSIQRVILELDSPMKGISVSRTTPGNNGLPPVVAVKVDGAAAKPGATGNLVFNAYTMTGGNRNVIGSATTRTFICTLPAVTYQVVAETP